MFPIILTGESKPLPSPGEKQFTDFLRVARERFQQCADAERDIRKEAEDDHDFWGGKQWPAQIEADRLNAQRPCLTINRLRQFGKQVVNEQRQNRPSIQINPVGDGADKETAEIFQGIARHIEINSNAEQAYDTAFEHSVIGGFGYFRILTDYFDDKSTDQEIFIERIVNPFTVYIDPSAQKADRSDMQFAFIVRDLTKEQFKARWPNATASSLSDFSSIGDGAPDWFPQGKIRVAEYFHIETKKRTLLKFQDGSTAYKDEILPEHANEKTVRQTREVEIPTVQWEVIDAVEKLEETTWPGRWIPIVPVLGDEYMVNNKPQLAGIVRFAKDAQRMYNYERSNITEMIALAPKAPWQGAEGQFEGHEDEYKQSNVRNIAYLQYKPKSVGGELVPPPQRMSVEPPIQAATAALAQADNDLKATTGIYDASLGAPGPEQSGKAILARQKEGDTANYGFIANLTISITHTGRILLDLIPKIYDEPRIVRIVKPDATHETVPVNQHFVMQNGQPQPIKPGEEQQFQDGLAKIYDLSVGRYDVTVSTGPSYQSRRQEAAESMIELIKAYPAFAQVTGDLMVRMMDWPMSSEIADRLKSMLPPGLQGDQSENIPPQAQAQMAQLQQQVQQYQQMLQMAAETIKTKKMELESRERIAGMQAQAQIIAAELRAKTSSAEKLAAMDFASITKRLDLLHEGVSLDAEFAADQASQQAQHQHEAGQARLAQQAQPAQQKAA